MASTSWAFELSTGKPQLETDMWKFISEYGSSLPLWDEAYTKARAEFLVIGDAMVPNAEPTSIIGVEATVHNLTKKLLVNGDRHWNKIGIASKAKPFTTMTLDYAHAFGGEAFDKNPIGKGKGSIENDEGIEITELPNIEYPKAAVASPSDTPAPASYYPKNVEWKDRQSLAGTYDEKYLANAMPGFPDDIDWNFFNVAEKDQQFDQYLKGDERFRLVNLNAKHQILEGNLPGVAGRCFVNKVINNEVKLIEIPLKLDTVWLFPNSDLGIVLHRGSIEVSDMFAKEIITILCAHENISDEPRPLTHYQQQMNLRTDPEEGFKYMLNTSPLLPVGVVCGIKDLMDKGDVKLEQAGIASMQNYVKKQEENAEAELEKHQALIDENLAKVDINAKELIEAQKKKIENEKPKEAQEIEAIVNKIIPGVMDKGTDIDLTKLNLKAMDEFEQYMKNMAEEKKQEGIRALQDQLEELKRQPEGSPGLTESIAALEKIIRETIDPPKPILPRIELPSIHEELKNYNKQAQEYLDGIGDEAEKIDLEEKLKLDYDDIQKKIAEANALAIDGYRQGAHFMKECRSPHEGQEPALSEQIKDKAKKRANMIGDDCAFCVIEDIDFSGLDLRNIYFEYATIKNCNFNKTQLTGAIFSKAKISSCTFEECELTGANLGACEISDTSFNQASIVDITLGKSTLRNCSFHHCQFSDRQDQFLNTKFINVDFSHSDLRQQNFLEVEMESVKFDECDLSNSNFIELSAPHLSFNNAILTASNFVKINFEAPQFGNAKLDNTRFVGNCILENANLEGALILGSNLRDCMLNGANFNKSKAHKTDFSNSKLNDATFEHADCLQSQYMMAELVGADFQQANLMEASFMQSDLRNAKFKSANMYMANFLKATLGGTDFSDANLTQTLLKDWQPS